MRVPKFKVGDTVVAFNVGGNAEGKEFTIHEIGLYYHQYHTHSYDLGGLWIMGTKLEFANIYNSPLYKALS